MVNEQGNLLLFFIQTSRRTTVKSGLTTVKIITIKLLPITLIKSLS